MDNKYILNYKNYSNKKAIGELMYSEKLFLIGDRVKVSEYASKYSGLEGDVIEPSNLKDPNDLHIKFDDGKKAYVNVSDLARI